MKTKKKKKEEEEKKNREVYPKGITLTLVYSIHSMIKLT
jgi:hypothetical protein